MRTNDVSEYTTEHEIRTPDEVIELACALANINRLHEAGELAFSSDKLFETGQLSIIKEALQSLSTTENEEKENLVTLYRKLKQIHA
ncbi:MAG: hypothetical protein ACXAE3_09680 [Candidatus Kariarchaeaceae archaeon]|jgi:hypothetical protein